MVVVAALAQIAILAEVLVLKDCLSAKTVSKSPISKGQGVEGVRVSIATAWKQRAGLQPFSLEAFLLSDSRRLKWPAWNLQNRRNPKHRPQYHSQETPSTNSSHSMSGGSVVDSSKE